MNNDLETIRKEAFVASCTILLGTLLGGTEGNHGKSQSANLRAEN
jgi:hypothetical protein